MPSIKDTIIWEILRFDHECDKFKTGEQSSLILSPNLASKEENKARLEILNNKTSRKFIFGVDAEWTKELLTFDMLLNAITVWKHYPLSEISYATHEGKLAEYIKYHHLGTNAQNSQKSALYFASKTHDPNFDYFFNTTIWGKTKKHNIILDGTHRCIGLYISYIIKKEKPFPEIYCYTGIPIEKTE